MLLEATSQINWRVYERMLDFHELAFTCLSQAGTRQFGRPPHQITADMHTINRFYKSLITSKCHMLEWEESGVLYNSSLIHGHSLPQHYGWPLQALRSCLTRSTTNVETFHTNGGVAWVHKLCNHLSQDHVESLDTTHGTLSSTCSCTRLKPSNQLRSLRGAQSAQARRRQQQATSTSTSNKCKQ